MASYINGSVIDDPMDYVTGAGRMFYLINPKEHMFEHEEDVPNFYVQVRHKIIVLQLVTHSIVSLPSLFVSIIR